MTHRAWMAREKRTERMFWLQAIAGGFILGALFFLFVAVCFQMESLVGGM